MNDIHWLTATALRSAYEQRTLSPVTVVDALLERIGKLNGSFDAFIRVDAEGAQEAARAAEQALSDGRSLGPLHGVPIGIKDIFDVAGQPTTCHSKIMLDHVAAQDAAVITRLREAGAILLGKLALHEFATGGPCFDLPFPPARNPWNREHIPGGSSSGSGAALAAGLVPLALGTDTGGSIRGPAGFCGVVGLKPTAGSVSRRGVFPLSASLDTVGPMARSVADIALLQDVMAGRDPGDPTSVVASSRSSGADLGRGVRGMRIGFVRHFHEEDMRADPETIAALESVARTLIREGAEVVTVRLPPLNEMGDVYRVIMPSGAAAIHAAWLRDRPGDYARATLRKLMAGAAHSPEVCASAQRERAAVGAAIDRVLHEVDVLMTVNSMEPACRLDADDDTLARSHVRQARNPFNLSGHPALAMMCGLSAAGLPLSVQFVARAHDETTLLRVASAYEQASGWHARHPLA